MRARFDDWRFVLFAGVLVAVALATVGFGLQRMAYGIAGADVLRYQPQAPTPFEREIYLESDHSVVLADGDQDLWYFAGAIALVLTVGSLPLVRARGARAAMASRAMGDDDADLAALRRAALARAGARDLGELAHSPAVGGLEPDLAAVLRLRLGLDRSPPRPRTRAEVAEEIGLGGSIERMVAALEDDALEALSAPERGPARRDPPG